MNQKKEIIIFTDSMGNCGINRVLSELTDAWINQGHKVSVAYINKENSRYSDFAIGAAAPFMKNRIIISDRNDPRRRPSGKIKQFFGDMAFNQADVLILQTEDVKKYHQERIHMTGVVIPNPINNNMPAPIRGGHSLPCNCY